jgi:hypothetical protein
MSEETVALIWRRRLAWSRAADRLKANVTIARAAALIMSAAGATLTTVAATLVTGLPHWRTGCAAAGAVLIAAATFVTTRFITTDAVRAWTRARSVSEAIKADMYSFRAAAAPFDGADALAVLQREVRAVEDNAKDLERYVAAVMVRSSNPPPVLPPLDYVAKRVMQQVDGYYRRKAKLYASRLAGFRGTELALGLIATVLGALAAFISNNQPDANAGVAAWVAVFTTLGAAFAAHVAASRYEFLVMSYYATARRLEDLVGDWRAQGSPTDAKSWSAFVHACENAISVENEGWLAKWAEKDAGK